MEEKSLYNNQRSHKISKNLQNYIDGLVEDIVSSGKPFDMQKKYLKKFSENEGLDYMHLESSLSMFIEILENLKNTPNKLMETIALEKGQDSHISDSMIKHLLSRLPQNARFIITNSKTQRVGFIDVEGNVVIKPQYIKTGNFNDGLAKVLLDKKWGYINYHGEEVTPLVYDGATDFSGGMAAVKRSSKWGFIDNTGKEVVPRRYPSEIHTYSLFSEDLAVVELHHKSGYIDKMGNTVIPFEYSHACRFSEGLACVQLLDGRLTIINKSGNEAFDFKYDSWGTYSGAYSDGRLSVAVETSEGMKWGFIDSEGNEIIPCKYDHVEDFHEGVAVVRLNHKYGYIDANGIEITPCIYEYACDFSEGLGFVQDSNYLHGFIDKNGHPVVPCMYSNAYSFSDGVAAVQQNKKLGYIDKTGKEIIPCKYDPFWDDSEHTIWSDPSFVNGLAIISIDGKMAYIDKMGRTIWIDD